MNNTGLIDIENKSISIGDNVEIYSCGHRVAFGKIIEVDNVHCVDYLGEHTEYMIMNLDYLAHIKAIKVVDSVLK